MPMDQFLAEYYGTANAPAVEDYEKQASVELFLKLASEEGIDLNTLSDNQVEALYSNWVKNASEEKDDEKEEKVEAAKKEHEEKKAHAEKIAEADFLGRVMAHSYVQEMRKIAGVTDSVRSGAANAAKSVGRAKELLTGSRLKAREWMHGPLPEHVQHAYDAEHAAVRGARRTAAEVLGGAALAGGGYAGGAHAANKRHDKEHAVEKMSSVADKARGAWEHVKSHPKSYGGGLAGAALLASGGYALKKHHDKKKALDSVAGEHAVEKASAAGWNVDEAIDRVSAILTLGAPDEDSKVAAADTFEQAVDIRANELLEMAGYPIDWS